MPTAPESSPVRRRRRRLEQPKGWKAVPRSVKILAGVCILILLLFPLAKEQGWIGKRRVESSASQESVYKPGLGVAEAALDANTRTIKGVVENLSAKTMDSVEVSYEIRDRTAELVEILVVKIGTLKPSEKARFESEKLPPAGTQWYMHSLSGTPR